MMNFRAIKTSLIDNILGPAEAGRFQTIGFQRQAKQASESLNSLRTVQVFYDSGDFPKNSGRRTGSTQHDIIFKVEFTVSSASVGNLTNVNAANQALRAAAITAFQEASSVCDESFDELVEIVYQILMDARNVDLGLGVGIVTNRWIERAQKNEALPSGEYVTLTGSMIFSCRTVETVSGDTGTAGTIFDSTVPVGTDPNLNTGAKQTN